MDFIRTLLAESPITYVTRDIERALGTTPSDNYRIVTNNTRYAREIRGKYPNFVLLVESETVLDTEELLSRPEVLTFIKATSKKSSVLVFKNTKRIERIAKENNINLLNPSAELAQKVEDKISQVEWLGELACHLPPHNIAILSSIEWNNEPFIIQYNHAHTGGGTVLIKDKHTLEELKLTYPARPVKKSTYIPGPVYTLNCIASPNDQGVFGNISYQITGIKPFTEKPFATIGNDWGFAKESLGPEQIKSISKMAAAISQKLNSDGWKGLFGIDFLISEKTGQVYLLEINARQAASTTYESTLQNQARSNSSAAGKENSSLTIFEAHLASFSKPVTEMIMPIASGAQIIQRHTSVVHTIEQDQITDLNQLNLTTIVYEDGTENSDLVRIQSTESLVKKHGTLNNLGLKIGSIVHKKQAGLTLIHKYQNLSLGNKIVVCPYFNNKKKETRAGLRVLIGKGTPQEICEEAELFAVREKINLASLSENEIRNFLIRNRIGIDCSGFAFHVLNEVSYETTGKKISSHLSWASKKTFLRKIISAFRPAENCGVRTFAHNSNSQIINLSSVKKWDIVTVLTDIASTTADHIFLITNVSKNDKDTVLSFVHAIAWPKDGLEGHGVHEGKIRFPNNANDLTQAVWTDDSLTSEEYSAYLNKVKNGLELRRLNWLAK